MVRHPSEHGTSSMWKQLLPRSHIAKLNELPESEVTELTSWMVNEPALVILKSQGTWGIAIVSSPRIIIFDIQVNPYWLKWQTKCSKLAANYIESSEFQQDTWNRYLILRFVSAPVPWDAISNQEQRWSYKTSHNDQVLPSTLTLSNSCRREYPQPVDEIEKQLQLRNTVSLALDGLIARNSLAITLVIAYYTDRNWALREVQLPFDEVNHQFCSPFEI